MISVERMLKHMAWSNQHVLHFLQELPDEALDAYVVNPEWNVGRIVGHLVGASGRLGYHLSRDEVTSVDRPQTMTDVAKLVPLCEKFDAVLLREAAKPDERVLVINSLGENVWWRSTVVSQAIHHATEHRAQLACALESKGFAAPDLDEIDLWAFESHND